MRDGLKRCPVMFRPILKPIVAAVHGWMAAAQSDLERINGRAWEALEASGDGE